MTQSPELHLDVEPWRMIMLEPENEFEGEGVAYVLGDLEQMAEMENGPLIRIHSECVTGEVFGSLHCECGPQLAASREAILEAGIGIVFYLFQEGRGAGLAPKLRGYELTERLGVSSGEAYRMQGIPVDQRQYGHCVRFLREHGIMSVQILTNSPDKLKPLTEGGIACIRLPLDLGWNNINGPYRDWKRNEMGHMLDDEHEDTNG